MTRSPFIEPSQDMLRPRFNLRDMDIAHEEWGANCGPGALAVVSGISLVDLRPNLGDFERKGYTNPKLMLDSLRRLGLATHSIKPPGWPMFGIVRVQWEGPWTEPGVPLHARYRYTHWVAGSHRNGEIGVFDVNCLNNGSGWVSLADWSEKVVPHIVKFAAPRGNGKWHLTHSLEITGRLQ